MKRIEKNCRPDWDSIWMKFAFIISERSVDERRKVGAVIVSSDNTQVLAMGYNGNYKGGPNIAESIEPGKSGFIHAEINALIKLDYNNHKNKIMYVTTMPCSHCAKCIVNSGIRHVVYSDDYRDTSGIDILKSARIKVRKISL
jgi:dCMP deaminase